MTNHWKTPTNVFCLLLILVLAPITAETLWESTAAGTTLTITGYLDNNTPAAVAKIPTGDTLISVNEMTMQTTTDYVDAITSSTVDDKIAITTTSGTYRATLDADPITGNPRLGLIITAEQKYTQTYATAITVGIYALHWISLALIVIILAFTTKNLSPRHEFLAINLFNIADV